MTSSDPRGSLEQLLGLVRRELRAEAVDIVSDLPREPPPDVLVRELGRECWLLVEWAPGSGGPGVPGAGDRLDALLECFGSTLGELARSTRAAARPPPPEALHAELRDLVERAGVADALLVDGASGITWCSARTGPAIDAEGRPLTEEAHVAALRLEGPRLVASRGRARAGRGRAVPPGPRPDETSAWAAEAVKALAEVRALPEGRPLRRTLHDERGAILVRSVGDIYALALVSEGDVLDEIRAERALALALPRVERLLAALPPLDPTPEPWTNVVSLAARRR